MEVTIHRLEALPDCVRRRGARFTKPRQADVSEELIDVNGILEPLLMWIRPRLELLGYPGELSYRRVRQCVADRFRSRRLDCQVTVTVRERGNSLRHAPFLLSVQMRILRRIHSEERNHRNDAVGILGQVNAKDLARTGAIELACYVGAHVGCVDTEAVVAQRGHQRGNAGGSVRARPSRAPRRWRIPKPGNPGATT